MWNVCHKIYLPEFNAQNGIEINANITELCRFKVAVFTSYEKSDQKKKVLRANKSWTEVTLQGQHEGKN